jgi:hypothetical protein
MAGFNLSFKDVFSTSKFKQFLAVCVASDSNVENETYLYNKNVQLEKIYDTVFINNSAGEYTPTLM